MSIICISRLPILLKERQMTVLSLQRQLAQQGRIVSKNTLYRLASWQPLKKVDLTIAGEICSLLGIGLSELFVIRRQKEGEKRVTFTDEQKARMRILLELAREGTITPAEERELQQLVDEEWEAAIDAAEEAVMVAYPIRINFSTILDVVINHGRGLSHRPYGQRKRTEARCLGHRTFQRPFFDPVRDFQATTFMRVVTPLLSLIYSILIQPPLTNNLYYNRNCNRESNGVTGSVPKHSSLSMKSLTG